MTQEKEELQFPLMWDKCPACGSPRRVADIVKEEEIPKGKWRADLPATILPQPTAMIDPLKIQHVLTFTMLISMLDICADCGCLYAFRIDKTETSTDQMQRRSTLSKQ